MNIGYQEHKLSFFSQLNALKFMDMVKFKTAQIMSKARHNILPGNIQKMFSDGEGDYNLRGELNLRKLLVHTTMKSLCITICGLNLWNGLDLASKQSTHIVQFNICIKRTSLAGIEWRKGCVDSLYLFLLFI